MEEPVAKSTAFFQTMLRRTSSAGGGGGHAASLIDEPFSEEVKDVPPQQPSRRNSWLPTTRRSSISHNSIGAESNGSIVAAARHQRRSLRWAKRMIVVILILTCALFVVAAYAYVRGSERRQRREEFSHSASKAASVIRSRIQNWVQSQKSLSRFVTSVTPTTAWPFVTVSAWEMVAGAGIFLAPLVEPYQRAEWEEFAMNDDWISESKNFLLEPNEGYSVPLLPTLPGSGGSIAPIRQVAPIAKNNEWIGVDVLALEALKGLGAVGGSVLASTTETVPISILLTPVFNRFPTVDNPTQNVVGLLVSISEWMKSILADGLLTDDNDAPEIHLIVRSPCNTDETFAINGQKTTYVGSGDLHDDEFEHLEIVVPSEADIGGACPHTFHLFPTKHLESDYLSFQPEMFASVVVVVFLLILFTIWIYDTLIERRMRWIVLTAYRSETLVSSLFPETVRQRLLQRDITRRRRRQSPVASNRDLFHNDGIATVDEDGSNVQIRRSSTRSASSMTVGGEAGSQRRGFLQRLFGRRRCEFYDPSISGGRPSMWSDVGGSSFSLIGSGKPIADLFPNATVLFADIAGFTAWSSVREPTQVFILLERIYNSFDLIANRRRVFKVETIGDCYVAATGLPERRSDHALIMSQFSSDCMIRMRQVVRKLEVILGPDTAELTMRFGMHSGPVTAGVLRGEKSRFQLFGDTVNTAARMESTGLKDKIQISQDTANELIQAGKSAWIQKRKDLVDVKGKGKMQTYWLILATSRFSLRSLSVRSTRALMRATSDDGSGDGGESAESGGARRPMPLRKGASNTDICTTSWYTDEEEFIPLSQVKRERLIDWNVDVLQGLLRKIIAMRGEKQRQIKTQKVIELEVSRKPNCQSTLDEVEEIIVLPGRPGKYKQDPEFVVLSPVVKDQVRDFVSEISRTYRDNAFHSFEHASHVVQSVNKLMARVVTPDAANANSLVAMSAAVPSGGSSSTSGSKPQSEGNSRKAAKKAAVALHEYTFGITSDPLTQFACAFSALVHDVDHPGVGNATLVAEKTMDAIKYKNKSVAEQKSVDLAWELLMSPRFADLRACIYSNQAELDRFRQLVVNSVMATDIADKELGALRKARWDKAFDTQNGSGDIDSTNLNGSSRRFSASGIVNGSTESAEDTNRKATIVIEHLIQASDVSHTMQHWHIYIKWNERFFYECYKAYVQGRTDTDPTDGWYEGELGFYDFYIIPLARKLKECGVFGVASDEYLNYAMANRAEWERKGRDIVQGYIEMYNKDEETISIAPVYSDEIDIDTKKSLRPAFDQPSKPQRSLSTTDMHQTRSQEDLQVDSNREEADGVGHGYGNVDTEKGLGVPLDYSDNATECHEKLSEGNASGALDYSDSDLGNHEKLSEGNSSGGPLDYSDNATEFHEKASGEDDYSVGADYSIDSASNRENEHGDDIDDDDWMTADDSSADDVSVIMA